MTIVVFMVAVSLCFALGFFLGFVTTAFCVALGQTISAPQPDRPVDNKSSYHVSEIGPEIFIAPRSGAVIPNGGRDTGGGK